LVWFGPRVVLELRINASLQSVIDGRSLRPLRFVQPSFHILDAGDAWTALTVSAELADHPAVLSCRPVLRQDIQKHLLLAARPNDTRYNLLWHLENRHANGTRRGPDLGAREAWSKTRGAAVIVAVVDDGVELTHPDLAPAASNSFHFNFTNGTTNALPASAEDFHATLVAGFALARDNNNRGVTGLAPRASLANWKIFNGSVIPDGFDDQLADMFQYLEDTVHVQNHSWGNAASPQLGPTPLEQAALDNALNNGRSGRGVVMVRAAGNDRQTGFNANDDGYANDPRVIAVGAVDSTGQPADYSNPGACLLVAAFGGSPERLLTTTDRLGTLGLNTNLGTGDSADYITSSALQGTSFSAPQISGMVALLLAVRPDLTIRDVQHLLALGARQVFADDPDLVTNAGGFLHSHNTGFGIPNAGRVVDLAQSWSLLPPETEHLRVTTVPRQIPDDGLRVLVSGNNVPVSLRSLPATPGTGLHPDSPTAVLPLVDIGLATETVTVDLQGKAALIRRSPEGSPSDDQHTFEGKMRRAAEAGAAFAVIYNDRNVPFPRFVMAGIEFVPIPGVMLDQQNGTALANALAADPNLRVQLQLSTAAYTFGVVPTLRCEHVGVRVHTSHPQRGDVRLTLRSPQGTRSVLQHLNEDINAGPKSTWTYWSTRHLGEPSVGAWTVEISDESSGFSGSVSRVELVIRGVDITDSDADGLEDAWETRWFGNLQAQAGVDPDEDGWSNAQEALLQTDPMNAPLLRASLSRLDSLRGLITWNASPDITYDLETSISATSTFAPFSVVTATNREMESVLTLESTPLHLLRIRER
jgi:subtilisin family serine protease/subtilisin-like proprotein convertase family protein